MASPLLCKAQETPEKYRDAEPTGGIDQLAKSFFSIKFQSEEQRELMGKHLELVFHIDQMGVPSLEAVFGIENKVIVDSFLQKTEEIPLFAAARAGGDYTESMYALGLTYPSFQTVFQHLQKSNIHAFRKAKMEDFEKFELKDSRFDFVFGGVVNTPAGSISNHLRSGGGLNLDFIFTGRNGWGGGLVVTGHYNRLFNNFSIPSTRPNLKYPTTNMIGLSANKWMPLGENPHGLLLQLELNYTYFLLTENEGKNDPESITFKGFSPGLSVHFPLRIGQPTASTYYNSPVLITHHINIHAAARPLFLDFRQTRGMLFELGISYRIGITRVKSYEFTDSYLLNHF
nr:hypothetical protein [Saprospiraceae bacterium]